MSLSDFATFSTALSGIAVTASLIYLAVQTQQNSRHTRALLQQGQADRAVSALLTFAQSDLAGAWIAGNGGEATPEAVKSLQFAQLCNAVVNDMSDFHNQWADGLARGEQYEAACMAYSTLLRLPGVSAYWASWREGRLAATPRFIGWVDDLAKRTAVGRNPNWV